MDLMSFSVLNPGEIVYESRDIGPPPPLFEDPSIIRGAYSGFSEVCAGAFMSRTGARHHRLGVFQLRLTKG